MEFKNFIYSFIWFVIFGIFFDMRHIYRFKWCKKKFTGMKCDNWMCKKYKECPVAKGY